jgi:hypothetical protein
MVTPEQMRQTTVSLAGVSISGRPAAQGRGRALVALRRTPRMFVFPP